MRKWMCGLLICAVVGLVAQTAVAWVLMLYVPVPMDPYKTVKGSPPEVYSQLVPAEWGPPAVSFAFEPGVGCRYYQLQWGESADPRHMLHMYECGFPLRSLFGGGCGDFPVTNKQGVTWDVGYARTPVWTSPPGWMWANNNKYTCAIVFYPLWAGVSANSAFYGALFALVWWVIRKRRFARRRSKGLCIDCGYGLAGLAKCPECGEPVLRSSSRSKQ